LPIEIYEGQEGNYLESGFTQWGASGLAAVWAEEILENPFSAHYVERNFCNQWK